MAWYLKRVAQDPVTVIDNGAPAGTTALPNAIPQADSGYAIPIAPPGGGPIQEIVTTPAATLPPTQASQGGVFAEGAAPAPDAVAAGQDCSGQCSLFFQFIDLFYWPTENTNNTACLAGVTDSPPAMPTDLNPISPSVYLVFPTISAGNSCTRVGNIYERQTIAMAPEAVSSIIGTSGVAAQFNYADLPCPPPDVASAQAFFYNPQFNPGRAYGPMISPPPELFALDPAFKDCVAAVYQGFDPPKAMPTGHGPSGPGGFKRRRSYPRHPMEAGSGPGKRSLQKSQPAHRVPRGPAQTPFPL